MQHPKITLYTFQLEFSTNGVNVKFNIDHFFLFQNVNNLLQACSELYNSKNFQLMLEYVLSVGNILNTGSTRGGAYGFRLHSLPKVTCY